MKEKRKHKKSFRLCVLLMAALMTAGALSACSRSEKSDTPSSADEVTTSSQSAESNSQSSQTSDGGSGTSSPNQSNTADATSADLYCLEFTAYSGVYVEDGKNEVVEDVAAILVENRSEQFLDRATITYLYGNKYAYFVVTGLPAGEKCWVLEKNKLTLEEGHSFLFEDCVSAFKADAIRRSDLLETETMDNTITIKNISPRTLENVCVYYKNTFDDGNYLGGITYVVNFGTMEAGSSLTKESAHFSANSEIVRFSYQ